MSFPRAKLSRFQEIPNCPYTQDSEKAVSEPYRTMSRNSPFTRSFSQPSAKPSSRENLRPRSCGDENKTSRPSSVQSARGETNPDLKDDSREFEETIFVTSAELPTDEEISNEKQTVQVVQVVQSVQSAIETPKSPTAAQRNEMAARKSSASGIPLLIKGSPAKSPGKTTPRSVRGTTTPHSPNVTMSKGVSSATRRSMELQFMTKKKKFDQLKKELSEKQKPILEVYHSLVQLKKKLEECGKALELEDLKFVDCRDNRITKIKNETKPDVAAGGEIAKMERVEIDPELVLSMRNTVKQIPLTLLELCRNMLNKRALILGILEKSFESEVDPEEVRYQIQSLKAESANLEKQMEETFTEQDKHVIELTHSWQNLLEKSGLPILPNKEINELQQRLKEMEQKLMEVTIELQHEQLKSKGMVDNDEAMKSEQLVNQLQNKISSLESELSMEKTSTRDHRDKNAVFDHKTKALKSRVKELETRKQEIENSVFELQRAIRHAQDNLKANEKKWEKEKEDLVKAHRQDKLLLERITKEKTQFETREHTLKDLLEEEEKRNKNKEAKLYEELENARKIATEEQALRESMEKKYESIQNQLVRMETRNQQAVDLVNTRKEFKPNEKEHLITEREAELYTELLATRVALKAAEEKLQSYAREKLRFIDSIEMFGNNPENNVHALGSALVKKEEEITQLENIIMKNEETISNQKAEIANLQANVTNLQQRLEAFANDQANSPAKDNDLRRMLQEGRAKLDQSLRKCLEYEQKMIKYEHELNKQAKQFNEMENLLKVRDGLISMVKAKKDELTMENESLTRYATEVRELLFQVKDDVRSKAESLVEMTLSLESRNRQCYKLEKKIKDLEGNLSITNEKRFKLQETVGQMEKELQSTKAHINRISSDVQTRYDPGMKSSSTEVIIGDSSDNETCCSENILCPRQFHPLAFAHQLIHSSMKNINAMQRRLHNLSFVDQPIYTQNRYTVMETIHTPTTDRTAISNYELSPPKKRERDRPPLKRLNFMHFSRASGMLSENVSPKHRFNQHLLRRVGSDTAIPLKKQNGDHLLSPFKNPSADILLNNTTRTNPVPGGEKQKEFIDHAHNILEHLKQQDELAKFGTSCSSSARKNALIPTSYISTKPASNMEEKNIKSAQESVAKSMNKIRQELDSSVTLVKRLLTNKP